MDDVLQKLKKMVRSCYTDWLLANQIVGKPVRISFHKIVENTAVSMGSKFIDSTEEYITTVHFSNILMVITSPRLKSCGRI